MNYLSSIGFCVCLTIFCISCHQANPSVQIQKGIVVEIDSTAILNPVYKTDGEYKIYIVKDVPVKEGMPLFYDTLTSYYSHDAASVEQKLKEFKGTPVNRIGWCGYDYNLYVVLNDSVIQTAAINSGCRFVLSNRGAFELDTTTFYKLTEGLKILSVRNYEYSEITQAREERKKLTANMPLALKKEFEPGWYRYEGSFYVEDEQIKKFNDTVLINQMRLSFPQDTFMFWADYNIIWCSEQFYKKFKLFKKSEWERFSTFSFMAVNLKDQ
jgi:hypothetical protein